jgi:hypothetical protein
MTIFARRYGARPLHLLAMIASFALAGYAAIQLFHSRSIEVFVWFAGAAVGHDLLLLPLYAIADSTIARGRRRSALPGAAPWINYVRIPAAASALLLLVYLPSIARLSSVFTATTGLSSEGYFSRWLGITGVLFLLSGLALAIKLRRTRAARPTSQE